MSSGPVRNYLIEHEHSDIQEAILKNREMFGIPTGQLLEQIAIRRKAREKLPLYFSTPNIIYPPSENFEQSSSERTAVFKSEIAAGVLDGGDSTGVDLTAGFGVDAYFLGRRMTRFHCVEPNQSLLDIARYNHKLLGVTNTEYHHTTAEDFLKTTEQSFDLVYIDPSRRTDGKRKVIGFEESKPDIVHLATAIFERTTWLMVKASPLLDLQAGISQLPFVKSVFVVSVDNECKEILFLSLKGHSEVPEIEAINFPKEGDPQTFHFSFPEERTEVVKFDKPRTYLYEPNASIMKAGAFKSVASRYRLRKLHPNTHLYTSEEFVSEFPGRKFRIEAIVRPDRSAVRKHLPEGQANVATRNYPMSAEALKKKTGLKDGGEKFLIGFTGMDKKYVAVASRL